MVSMTRLWRKKCGQAGIANGSGGLINFSCVLMALFVTACIIIPTPEFGDTPYTPEQVEQLQNGVGSLSRGQVLQFMGPPSAAYAQDRIFVYEWRRSQGILVSGVASSGNAGGALDSHHNLCLRFDAQGTLDQLEHHDSMLFDTDKAKRETVDAWTSEIEAETLQ